MKNYLMVFLSVLALLALSSCDALLGAVRQAVDPVKLAEAVVSALIPQLAKLEGMTPEALTTIVAGLKDTLTSAVTTALPPPSDGESLGLFGQLAGFAITAIGTYFGVNIRRDRKYVTAAGAGTGGSTG